MLELAYALFIQLDVVLLRRRFREGKIKRCINIFDTDMSPEQGKIVERVTFDVIEKSKSLKAIVRHIQLKLESEFGGHWNCFAHSFGDYCIHKRKGSFISFSVDELKLTIFQHN